MLPKTKIKKLFPSEKLEKLNRKESDSSFPIIYFGELLFLIPWLQPKSFCSPIWAPSMLPPPLNLPRSLCWHLHSYSILYPYRHFKCENTPRWTQISQGINWMSQKSLPPVWCLIRWWYSGFSGTSVCSTTRCWNFVSGSKLKWRETSLRLKSEHESKSWGPCMFLS